MTIKDPKFRILDDVYHITPESPKGIVINITYNVASSEYTYQVTFSASDPAMYYYENELSRERRIV